MSVHRQASILFFGCLSVTFPVAAQQAPAQSPAPWEITVPRRPTPTVVIHVTRDCGLLPDPASISPGDDLQLAYNPDLCHLETVLHSEHREESVVGNELHTSKVEIREQEYVLQNLSEAPAIFVVEHLVPKNWEVDSDPQPALHAGDYAIFQVHAAAGEVVRLHVGMRHVSHQHTKRIKDSGTKPI